MSKLKDLLLARKGHFVPGADRINRKVDPSKWRLNHKGLDIFRIDPESKTERGEAKAFLRRHFYPHAPISVALDLLDPDPKVQAFVEREMDMYINSGASVQIRQKEELVGIGLCSRWPRDRGFEALEATALEWHNTAAEIAHEASEENEGEDPRLVWRDYQFQHLYNLAQSYMARYDRGVAMWAGCLGFAPSIKDSGVSNAVLKLMARRMGEENGLIGSQVNFRGFDRIVIDSFPKARLVDQAKYADERLTVGGRQVFKAIEHCDAIRFYIDLP